MATIPLARRGGLPARANPFSFAADARCDGAPQHPVGARAVPFRPRLRPPRLI